MFNVQCKVKMRKYENLTSMFKSLFFMIDMSFNYNKNLFIGFEIMTGKVDNDETLSGL